MFWKAKVRISEQSYKSTLPIIYGMRLFGIFPIGVHRDQMGNLYMQWSPIYAVYSCGIGFYIHYMSYLQMYKDITADHSESVRVRSRTDIFVNFGDGTATQIMAFSGIFWVSSKFLSFFNYVECINEVDSILLTKPTKWDTFKKNFIFYGWLFINLFILVIDYLMYIATVGSKLGAWYIFRTYFALYLGFTVLMVTEYEFQFMATSLKKRMQRLNEVLKNFNLIGGEPKEVKKGQFIHWRYTWHRNIMPICDTHPCIKKPEERIDDLMKSYHTLVDAAAHQNYLLGVTGATAITSAFLQLVTASYFLLSELGGNRQHPVFLAVKVGLCTLHVSRLLMVIEPWYNCTEEAETTKNLVCKLHYTKFGHQLRRKLRTFQIVLGLRTIHFSLADLAVIDRALLTSVLGTAVTYLVILLQLQREDTN